VSVEKFQKHKLSSEQPFEKKEEKKAKQNEKKESG
jgi:hypothetical protein